MKVIKAMKVMKVMKVTLHISEFFAFLWIFPLHFSAFYILYFKTIWRSVRRPMDAI